MGDAGSPRSGQFHHPVWYSVGGIVTLNYDLLVEYALGSRGFNYGAIGEVLRGRGPYPVSLWRNPVALSGRIPLAKLLVGHAGEVHGRSPGA